MKKGKCHPIDYKFSHENTGIFSKINQKKEIKLMMTCVGADIGFLA